MFCVLFVACVVVVVRLRFDWFDMCFVAIICFVVVFAPVCAGCF